MKLVKILSRGSDQIHDEKEIKFVILDSIKKDHWAGVYHFYAASNALKKKIQQVSPSIDYRKENFSDVNKFLNNIIKCDDTSQGQSKLKFS